MHRLKGFLRLQTLSVPHFGLPKQPRPLRLGRTFLFLEDEFQRKPREDEKNQNRRIEPEERGAAGGESHAAVKAGEDRHAMSNDDGDAGERDAPVV